MCLQNYFLSISLALSVVLISPHAMHFPRVQQESSIDLSHVKIKMVPKGAQPSAKGKPFEVGKNVNLTVVITNDSSNVIKAYVVDTYYENRPKLYKDGRLIPYRNEISRLLEAKDTEPEFVRVGSIVFLQPATTTELEALNLSDWYAALEPGLYKLTNKHRFDLNGPWSQESAELLFEVVDPK